MKWNDPANIRVQALELLIRKPSSQNRALGAVEFGTTAASLFAPGLPTNDQGSMLGTLGSFARDGANDSGGTDYDEAFEASTESQPNADARIFVTDGEHQGAYLDAHRGGPRTYVIGLDIGRPGTAEDADRLERIAKETGGQYFPLKLKPGDSPALQLRRLQPAVNKIDALLACQQPPRTIVRRFVRSRQQGKPIKAPFSGLGAMEIVTTRGTPGVRCRLIRAEVRDRRGQVIADLRGKKRIGKSKKRRQRLQLRSVKGDTYESWTVLRPAGGQSIQIWIQVGKIRKPVPVTVQLRPVAAPAPVGAPAPAPQGTTPTLPGATPLSGAPDSGRRVITVDNRVTNGGSMREDPTPVRLTTQPWTYCGSRGCNIGGTERGSGGTYDAAVCQTFGDRTTNGNDHSAADDGNPERFESTRYYGVRLTNGVFGYVSETWINAAHRGGLGLPPC